MAVTSAQRNIMTVVQWASNADKAWLIGQLLDGGVDMSDELSEALIPLTDVYRDNYEQLCAAVEEN